MRNEDLKNKLDQRPLDFDREALWGKIDQQPEKKNRLLVWWWLLGGLIIISSIYFITNYLGQSNQPKNVEQLVKEEKLFNKEDSPEKILGRGESLFDEEKQLLDNKLSKDGLESELVRENEKVLENASINEVSVKKEIANHRALTEQAIEKQGLIIKTMVNVDNEIVDEYVQEVTDQNQSIKDNVEIISSEIVLVDFYRTEGLLISQPSVLNKSKYLSLHNQSSAPFLQNSIGISIGIGSDLHQFENDNQYRRSILESNLESINANFSYKKYLFKNWEFTLGLRYTSSQTKTELTSVDDSPYTRSVVDGNTYIITMETSRKLFNRYSRWDGDLSIGYKVRFGEWSITPSIGRGINLNAQAFGEVITLDNNIIDLQDLGIYSDRLNGYWMSSFEIDRSISEKLRLGLVGNIQSSRLWTTSDHKHVITPISLNLRIEWLW